MRTPEAIQQDLEAKAAAMYKAMRAVMNAAPLPATPIALGALADLSNLGGEESKHAQGFLKLHYLAALHPETAPAVRALCDMVIADALPEVRKIAAGMKLGT